MEMVDDIVMGIVNDIVDDVDEDDDAHSLATSDFTPPVELSIGGSTILTSSFDTERTGRKSIMAIDPKTLLDLKTILKLFV